MFQLTKNVWGNLESQNAISSWGGRRKPPNIFTEQGVSMLSAV
ncbi:MAG: ORF6N domain-containing protein [Bacteroidales bacterium]|nr:ORF6N domain-containing protein [Bacteroidales bacterium]